MNIISTDNLKNISQSFLSNLIQSSSEINGCPITNILEKETKSIWLSEEFLPQEIILHINKDYFKYFPKKLSTIGIYCWHAYSTNPKLIEILISINNSNNFISLGNFDLGLKPGMQLLQLDEDLLLDNDNNKLNENIFIKIIIKETFGGKRTYINNLSLYEDIDLSTMNLKSIQEENDEEDTSVVYLHESRIKNNLKNQKKIGKGINNINNGNILLTSEILISDSDLSDRKIFGDKVDKFLGINSGKKENNSSLKKVNNNKIIISKNNIIKSKDNKKDISPIKSNTPIKQDKNTVVSDKKSVLNSNIFTGNNNIINTQTSQNNMNNQLLTTEMLQNDFFTPEKQNKFYCSKGEISNIEFIGENQSLINEFRAYQKSQEEKQKKFEERITNIENRINDMNSKIINITNNLNDLIKKEKSKEKEKKKEKEIERELILKECEQMIKITLIDILEKKLNFDEEKKQTAKKITRVKNKVKQINRKNYNSNKIPESKSNKYSENFYQTYYNINNNQNTIDYSYNQNITLDPNNNYMTHKLPFYHNNSINNNSNNSNNNSNNNIVFNHKRNSTFSLNYLNNKNNLDFNNNTNTINISQNTHFENKFNISSNNYSHISDSYLKEKIKSSHRNQYYDAKSDIDTSHTPMNISNYKIPHNNTHYTQNLKSKIRDSIQSKEQTIKLKKNKSNFSNLSMKKHNTISNSHQNSHKILLTKRQHSHTDLRRKDDIANKINNHLEEKFADIGDKIGKNINENLLKPSLAKIKKIMTKNLKQVRNSIKKAEINQRSVRSNNYSYNS